LSEGGVTHLLWIASQASPDVLSVFQAANRDSNTFFAAVVCPREFKNTLDELALATGAALILREAGCTERAIGPQHLGRAKSAWVDRDHFGVLASTNARAAIRQRLTGLTQAFDQAEAADTKAREALRVRIGRLAGKSAIVTVGGVTERDISARRQSLMQAAQAVRAALLGGVLPGGGVALLGCQERLRSEAVQSACEDERAAIRILIRALEQPFRSLLCNAGMDEAEWLAGVRNARAATTGVDVLNRRTANMVKAGIVDVASVHKAAVYGAVTGAALALTVDVLVERKKPVESYTTA
jgi:chaperonin GroEL